MGETSKSSWYNFPDPAKQQDFITTTKHEVQKINYYKGLEEAGKNILSLDAEFTSIKI